MKDLERRNGIKCQLIHLQIIIIMLTELKKKRIAQARPNKIEKNSTSQIII